MNSKTITTLYKDYIRTKAHIAHKSLYIVGKKRIHPYNVNFILGCKNKHVINHPYQSVFGLLKSLHVISFFYKLNKTVLIVNTNPEMNGLIENFYHQTDLKDYPVYYCNEKWVGGFLTNWKVVRERVETFLRFSERFENFISLNHINFPSYKKMASTFQGFKKTGFTKGVKRPDLVFLVNPNENRHVVEEAVSLNIPVIAITDSNTNLLGISFPIPGNSNSVFFVHYCLQWITRILTACQEQKERKGVVSFGKQKNAQKEG